MRYSDYTETDKFLDELFAEDAELGWSCEDPTHEHKSGVTVTVVKGMNDNSPEEQYAVSLAEEINEKLQEIVDFIPSLSDESSRDSFLTKQNVIQRLIDTLNSVNSIIKEFESSRTANKLNGSLPGPMNAVIGGGFPTIF
jgi:hypothetical protein